MKDSKLKTLEEAKNEITIYFQHESVEDLLYEFLKERTPLTENAYRRDLKDFFAFTNQQFNLPRLNGNKMTFEEIRRVHVVKYKNYLETTNSLRRRPFAPNSVNRKISSISSFFLFLVRREILDKNPAEFCVRPRRTVLEETQAFTDREMKNLFDLVIDEAPPLHKAVILLLFTTGMRQAELRGIKMNNFIQREGITFLRYMGKGQKMNEVPVHPTTAHYINEYLAWMERIGRKVEEADFLFQPTKNTYDGEVKKKLSHTAIGYIVKKWARKINKDKRITPHSARATFISSLIDNGEDIFYVSQLVNHADVRTTQRYNKRKRSFRKNPVFNLNFF
jgi:site-specific recombinase XerD